MILEDLLADQVVESYSVRLPSYVNVSKKNVKALNLNVYRNLHHYHLSTQKNNFADDVKPLLRDKPRAEKVWIHYTIFASRNGTLDTMNVGAVADKYFSDTMVEAGKIPDDSHQHVVLCTFSFGGVRPMDGHVIATVNILEKESQPMRVMLDEEDIQAALDAHVKTLGLPGATGVEMNVNDDGDIEAEVLMGEIKPKNKGGRPRGSKTKTTPAKATPKPEETADDSKTDSEGSGDGTDSGSSDESAVSAEAGAEAPADEKPEGKTKKGNLFGDEDGQSSDSTKTSETTEEATTASKVKAPKKSSIFDVE